MNLPSLECTFLSVIHRHVLLRRAAVNRWASRNKEYLRLSSQRRRASNPELYLLKDKEQRSKPGAKAKRRINNRLWRENNVERRKLYMDEWKRLNRHRLKAYDVRRRAIRRQREKQAGFGNKEADALVAHWKQQPTFTCVYCGEVYPTDNLHVDHVKPVSKGGKHSVRNLARACSSCNHKKRDHVLPFDCWMFPGLYDSIFSHDQKVQ